ncbi:MAG: hypothetical protein K1X88_01950 [Nannocystaceae bacterium]|nr:hypothetical protein [Nannocystaceae bacterium]
MIALGIVCALGLHGAAPDPGPPPPDADVAATTTAATTSPDAGAAPEAAADEPTVPLDEALSVHAGATCLERERLVTQIRAWLDVERIDARLVVEVVGDLHEPRKLAFTLRRGETVIAVRRFDPAPKRCDDVHAVVGLAIALAIDATLLESVSGDPTTKPKPDPVPVEPATDDETPLPRKPDPPPARPRPPWQLRSAIIGVFSLGAPPGVGGGARFALVGRYRKALDLSLGVLATSSGRQRIGDASALQSAAAARFDLCGGWAFGRVRPRGCAGVIAGAALAAGQGFERDRAIRLPWVAVPLGAHLEIRLVDRIALEFGVEGVPTVVRPRFDAVTDAEQPVARRYSRFAFMAGAGLTFLLWEPRRPPAAVGTARRRSARSPSGM